MFMGLFIFIAKHIGANEDALLKLFPQVANDESGEILKLIQDLNFISKFDTYGKLAQMIIWGVFFIELAFYVWMFWHWFPKYVASLRGRGARLTERQLNRFINLQEKMKIGARLTPKEIKWYKKHQAKSPAPKKGVDS